MHATPGLLRLLAPLLAAAACAVVALPPREARAQRDIFGPIESISVGSPHPYPDGATGGSVVWEYTVVKVKASALRLHFAVLDIGPGDRVDLLDRFYNVVTSYPSRTGALWSTVVPGDSVTVRLVADDHAGGAGVEIDRFAFSSAPATDLRAAMREVTPQFPRVIIDEDRLRDINCLGNAACPDPGGVKRSKGESAVRLTIDGLDGKTRKRTLGSCTGFVILDPDANLHAGNGGFDLIMTARHCFQLNPNDVVFDIQTEFDAVYPGACPCAAAVPPAACQGGLPAACDYPNPAPPPANLPARPANACNAPDVCAPTVPCEGSPCNAFVWTSDPFGDCDWGMIKCSRTPHDATRPHLALASDIGSENDEAVYVPQHPKGRCKEIDDGKTTGVLDTCLVSHDVDTEGGSSGASVIRTSDNAVIGVHVQGIGVRDVCEGVEIRCRGTSNQFTRMSHIQGELALATANILDLNRPHLKCYEVSESQRFTRPVALDNQFGHEDCSIRAPATWLCVDTRKDHRRDNFGRDGFQNLGDEPNDPPQQFLTYRLRCSGSPPPPTVVQDQFARRQIVFRGPAFLMAPVASPSGAFVNDPGMTDMEGD